MNTQLTKISDDLIHVHTTVMRWHDDVEKMLRALTVDITELMRLTDERVRLVSSVRSVNASLASALDTLPGSSECARSAAACIVELELLLSCLIDADALEVQADIWFRAAQKTSKQEPS